MTRSLPASAQRVQSTANELRLDIAVAIMPDSTRTAADAAAACGCAVGQIVKSLIFTGAASKTPYLFLVSGKNRVNEAAVGVLVGESLSRADAQFVRAVTGFAIGGVPPFAHPSKLKTFVDSDLLAHDKVWAAAGTPKAVFSVEPTALARAVDARIIAVG
jgi:prolyl-tRNA editing enzyme YbaK/EbsC (Cys-tRNA(Pro) deacylase)